MTRHARRQSAFTLIEIMIVVALLGLLSAIALPQFLSHKEEGKSAAMVSSLTILRTAIDSYWTQHDGFPGQADAREFADQLLKSTNKAGEVGTGTGYGYGPYLRNGKLPVNPLSGTNSIRIVATMPNAPTGDEAWIYCKATGEIRCNSAGATVDGVEFFGL
jgi:prepilin-type N-terminal cleavage/methylation domain-containing protein